MLAAYSIEEDRSFGVSRYSVVVQVTECTQVFGAPDSGLPPSYRPGFWSIGEAESFIRQDSAARVLD